MDGGVPADDEVTSLTARSEGPGGPDWPVAFTTTHWSVVLTAQDESPAAHEALEKLCRFIGGPFIASSGDKALAGRRQRTLPRVFSRAIGAQKSERCPQGTGTTSFLSAWSAEIFSGQRTASCDGD